MISQNRKILILFSSDSLGGTEVSLTRMAVQKSNLFKYQLATMGEFGDWSDFCIKNKSTPKVYGATNSKLKILGFKLESIINLFKDIKFSKYELIYVLGFRASILLRILKLFLNNFKLVVGIRWNPNSKKTLDKVFRLSESILYKSVDHYICNSRAANNTMILINQNIKKRVSIIYNGIILTKDNRENSYEKNIYIIFPANIIRTKGHIQFLDIISEVIKKFPNIKFLMAGKDKMNGELNIKIKEKGLGEYIEVLGFKKNLNKLMIKSRFMVLPTFSEGCPTSIIEAFANKIPVIAYSIDGIPELISNGEDGFLIDPFNKEKFAAKIIYFLNNPNDAVGMGEKGRLKVEKLFTISKCAINHEKLFEKLLKKQ